jgi:hypothetical protein
MDEFWVLYELNIIRYVNNHWIGTGDLCEKYDESQPK